MSQAKISARRRAAGPTGPANNVSCYFLGPEDLAVEYTAEMPQIDAHHRAKEAAGLGYRFTDDGWRLDGWRS
jgi:hypothetical protein